MPAMYLAVHRTRHYYAYNKLHVLHNNNNANSRIFNVFDKNTFYFTTQTERVNIKYVTDVWSVAQSFYSRVSCNHVKLFK